MLCDGVNPYCPQQVVIPAVIDASRPLILPAAGAPVKAVRGVQTNDTLFFVHTSLSATCGVLQARTALITGSDGTACNPELVDESNSWDEWKDLNLPNLPALIPDLTGPERLSTPPPSHFATNRTGLVLLPSLSYKLITEYRVRYSEANDTKGYAVRCSSSFVYVSSPPAVGNVRPLDPNFIERTNTVTTHHGPGVRAQFGDFGSTPDEQATLRYTVSVCGLPCDSDLDVILAEQEVEPTGHVITQNTNMSEPLYLNIETTGWYRIVVKAINVAELFVTASADVLIDVTAPVGGAVYDGAAAAFDADYRRQVIQFTATWEEFSEPTGGMSHSFG